jgi:hypothetical protein
MKQSSCSGASEPGASALKLGGRSVKVTNKRACMLYGSSCRRGERETEEHTCAALATQCCVS